MVKDEGTIKRIQKGKKTDFKIASGEFKHRVLTQGKRATDKENKNILFRALSNRVKTEVRINEAVGHVELYKQTLFSKLATNMNVRPNCGLHQWRRLL